MPKYLFTGAYTQAGIEGVLKEGGTGRLKAVEALAASVGGRLESFYWAFGKDDFYIVCELPDHVAAAALASTVSATGSANTRTVVLLTAADIDQAAQRHPAYRRPGA